MQQTVYRSEKNVVVCHSVSRPIRPALVREVTAFTLRGRRYR